MKNRAQKSTENADATADGNEKCIRISSANRAQNRAQNEDFGRCGRCGRYITYC